MYLQDRRSEDACLLGGLNNLPVFGFLPLSARSIRRRDTRIYATISSHTFDRSVSSVLHVALYELHNLAYSYSRYGGP